MSDKNYRKMLEANAAGMIGFAVASGVDPEKAKRFVSEANDEWAETALAHTVRMDGPMLRATMESFIEEQLLREAVRARIKEVVRKKPGGGGYVLWSPNKGKKKPPKKSGDFPTKLQAKQALLDRFPPKDIGQLKRLRREIDRLRKDPKKRAEKERQWAAEPAPSKKPHKGPVKAAKAKEPVHAKKAEGLERISAELRQSIKEALFREEAPPSQWDDYVSRLPASVVETDKKLQNLHKAIQKQSEKVLNDAFSLIAKACKRSKAQAKSGGVKKDKAQQRTFLAFQVSTKTSQVGPIYIFVENGFPKIELSDAARQALAKMEPDEAKALRGDLAGANEEFEAMTGVQDAIAARDEYLQKVEVQVDDFVSDLNPLQVSVLKKLLVQKYRGKK